MNTNKNVITIEITKDESLMLMESLMVWKGLISLVSDNPTAEMLKAQNFINKMKTAIIQQNPDGSVKTNVSPAIKAEGFSVN